MKRSIIGQSWAQTLGLVASLLGIALLQTAAFGYETYSDPGSGVGNCRACHGDFRGTTSMKGTVFPGNNHEMHRNASSMATACNLCHFSDRSVVYMAAAAGTTSTTNNLGCVGCHVGVALRKHHAVNGTSCYTAGCHASDTGKSPGTETNLPPYYTSPDTRVRNPANTLQVANTNENWSMGDYLGLDNDGNGLYDFADYAVGPFRILSVTPEGNNMRVTFQTAGGRSNTIQSATSVAGTYATIGTVVTTNVGILTTNYLHVGGAANGAGFYRLNDRVP